MVEHIPNQKGIDKQADLAHDLASLQLKFVNLQQRHTALFELNQLSHDCEDLSLFYSQVHQTIASLMTAKNFYIVLYDQNLSTMEFAYHVDEKDNMVRGAVPYEQFKGSRTHYVIDSGQPLLATPELLRELVSRKKINLIGAAGLDWLGVPLIHQDVVIGVMAVQSYSETTRYQQQDMKLLTFAAQHVVVALTRLQDRERLQNAVSARTKELMQKIREKEKSELLQESLFRISELSNDVTLDINEFYVQVHSVVGKLIDASNFFIAKYDHENEMLNFVYVHDQQPRNLIKHYKARKLSNKYTELVIQKGKAVLLSRADMQALYKRGERVKPSTEVQSWLGVPLINSGEILGVMVTQSYQDSAVYSQQDAELLNFVSQQVTTSIKRRDAADYKRQAHEVLEQQVRLRTVALEDEIKQRKQAEQQLTHTACHDNLTGLPNRMVFIDLLNHAIACYKRHPKRKFAVFFLDLDRFKMVNDSFGHHAGDLLLKVIAKELSMVVRDMDTVARIGGDEFVILIEDICSEDEALNIAQRITELLARPFTLEDQPVFIGTSIGILFSDEKYDCANIMLRDADTAMYHAKDSGKGRYEVFDASMHSKIQHALAMETDIRHALEQNEFLPFFQPIHHLRTGQLVGFEALARWQSEKHGFVFPDVFIPLAEETNLVMLIDFQIMELACEQLKYWLDNRPADNLYVSCNLFCDHFFSTSLPDDIVKILSKVGLSPEHLRLELTEGALLENNEVVLANMHALRQLGIKILLDDFGTGYSSLSYLHKFPIDVLKIDRSFISNVDKHANHRAIIKTIIDLATNLKMATIGEGIENLLDAQLLQQMDCSYGQGYYFAKPMSAADAMGYLNENTNKQVDAIS
jgi:diguanylate cyclase (GGDEF)-like protein